MKKILFLVFSVGLMACADGKKSGKENATDTTEKVEAPSAKAQEKNTRTPREIFSDAVAVHDEIMPLMNELGALKMQLQEGIEAGQFDDAQVLEVEEAILSLETAKKDMMEWMNYANEVDYHLDSDAFSEQEKLEEVKVMKEAVVKMKADFEMAISKAKGLLQHA